MSIEQNTITGAHLVGSITTGIVVAGSSDDLERGEVDVEWVLNIQSADGPFLDRAEHRRREDRVGVECDLEFFAAFGTQMSGITEFGAATEYYTPPFPTHCPPTDRLSTMPKMNPEEVERIASLALIDLTEEEKERYASELGRLIDVFGTVADAVSADIPATSHPLPLSNVFRDDVPGETLPRDAVLAAAPEAEDGRFAVPQILGEDA